MTDQNTPPVTDVREALAAARNVELYLDMLAIDANDPEDAVIDDGYDGDGVIQSLEVPDLRTLVAFVREVHPHGTVPAEQTSDTEYREAVHRAIRDGIESVHSGAADRDVVRAAADRVLALEAAREVSSDV